MPAPAYKKIHDAYQQGNVSLAKKLIKKSLRDNPAPDEKLKLAIIGFGNGQFEMAMPLFKQAVTENPSLASEVGGFIEYPSLQDHFDIRVNILELALSAQPSNHELEIALALTYELNEDFETAEKYYLSALEQASNKARALQGLTNIYYNLNRFHDAVACGLLAIEADPNNAGAYYNTALSQLGLMRYQLAVDYLKQTLAIKPDHYGANVNLAHLMLKLGFFTAGWLHNEWRWSKPDNLVKLELPIPEWKGEKLNGKTLLLWADQGFGDQVMYAGLFQRLIDQGCLLSVVGDARLKNLMSNSLPLQGFYSYNTSGQNIEIPAVFDYQLSQGSLPRYLIHGFDDFGAGEAYLKADLSLVDVYRKKLREAYPNKTLVAIGWRGGVRHTRKSARTIGLDLWQPLFKRDDIAIINLQYDSDQDERDFIQANGGFTPAFDLKNDMDDLAAFLGAIDLFISADNSTVHLAGALGVDVVNIVPFAAEWRWFLEADKTYWYQSMRLIRQQQPGEWRDCLASAVKLLA